MAIFLISSFFVVSAYMYVRSTNDMLGNLINLYKIETMRQQLLGTIQTVQSDIYAVQEQPDINHQAIVEHVVQLKKTAGQCMSCHHEAEVTRRIEDILALTNNYNDALHRFIDSSQSVTARNNNKLETTRIGNKLLEMTQEMSLLGRGRLKTVTVDAMSMVRNVKSALKTSILLTLVLGVIASVYLTRTITKPVDALLDATRMITSGNFGYSITYNDKTEFGELASRFNVMSGTLHDSYAKLEEEISEHRRTEMALEKSEAFLNTTFDSIRDPFCIIDNDFTIVRANKAYADMKRTTLKELLGTTCFKALNNQNKICDGCIVLKTFETGDSCSEERYLPTADDKGEWNSIFTYPITDATGNISHVIEYFQDITERKLSEEALRESEERYALAAQGSNDGLWDWDLRSNIMYLSDRSKAMLGYSGNEIGTTPEEWLALIHHDDRAEIEGRIATHVSGRIPHFEYEYRIMHKDGKWRWVLTRGLVVRNETGQAYRMAGSHTDITANKVATEMLVYNAFHDALTDLPNRSLFMDRLQHVISASQRPGTPLYAVLFLDLDRFKVVNDSLGHLVGDKLLVSVGQKLVECVRPGDTVARLGGDEFSVLLEDIKVTKDTLDVADRIHQVLSSPFMIEGHEIYIGVSIGIALASPQYERAEQVLRDADIAMYEAKKRGQSSSEIFDTRMHAGIIDRINLEAELHGALDHNEFFLVYQPIVDLHTYHLVGFEALVRWNHPILGIVYPTQFIPVAEETGLIVKIGDWIMREACCQLGELQKRFPVSTPLRMSVNISCKQLMQENLTDEIAAAIKDAGIAADCLTIEITESMLMENIDVAVDSMNRLRTMGVHIHIDDFGTGYSSLSYLHSLPIDALKIDRSFVDKLTSEGENQEIILAIIMLAKSLNYDVIAEGVELEHQLKQIKGLECRFGQGYLFSRPLVMQDIDKWVLDEWGRKQAENTLST